MANVLLGVTGSVAAIRTPDLHRELTRTGHQVKIVATRSSLYFFDPAAFDKDVVHRDEDEWPGRDTGKLYQRGDDVLHIELRRWADVFAIAPLDANTLAKLSWGLCDNCLTCVWRAWDLGRPIVLAPAMNTLMWEHPLTAQHLYRLADLLGAGTLHPNLTLDALVAWINAHARKLAIVPPQVKELACGDVGVGAMADVAAVVSALQNIL